MASNGEAGTTSTTTTVTAKSRMSNGISEGYRELNAEELAIFADTYESAWKDPAMPERQYRLVVADELVKFRAGEDILPYRVALEALRQLPEMDNPSVLDVGAASGYYSEVFKIGKFRCEYTGLDYSESFKTIAQRLYPGIAFDVADACKLPYPDSTFDVTFHGACIMHVRNYEKAISEAVRVSKKYVIFHRTPIEDKRDTVFYAKDAYSVPCLEIHLSPKELFSIFERVGLKVIGEIDLFLTEEGYGHRTYICEKTLPHHPV